MDTAAQAAKLRDVYLMLQHQFLSQHFLLMRAIKETVDQGQFIPDFISFHG